MRYQKSIRANDGDRFLHFTVFTGTQPWLWHCAKGKNYDGLDDIVLAPGTMYGSLSKMEKDGLISFVLRGGQAENIRDHGTRQGSAGNRKETN